MKFNLDAWKKVAQDKDAATLRHADGHEIRIALKPLSPKMRKELSKLQMANEKEPEKYAEGGQVKKKDDVPFNKKAAADFSKGFNEGGGKEFVANAKKLIGFKDGGEVPDELEQIKAEASQQPPPVVVNVGEPPAEQPQGPTPEQQQVRNIYNGMVSESPSAQMGMHDFQGETFSGNEAPKSLDPSVMQSAVSTFKDQQAVKQQSVLLEQQKLEAQNQARAAAGLPPIPGSEAPPALNLAQTPGTPAQEQAAAAAVPGLDQSALQPKAPQGPSVQGAYEQGLAGINAEAAAQADMGKAQAKAIADDIEIQKAALGTYQEKYKGIEDERKAYQHDLENSHVDPSHYWDSKSTGGQISTAIGLLLGGIGAGLAHGENVALKTLEKNIDRDIEAQKANIGNKNNLLKFNMERFKNLEDATRMTKLMQMDLVTNQLKLAAANATSPLAKARAMQAGAQWQEKAAQQIAPIAKNQSVAAIMDAIRANPANLQAGIRALEQIDPKRAEEVRNNAVPGIGLANTTKDADTLKELKTSVDGAQDGIKQLQGLIGKTGKSLSPNDRARAQSIQQALVGQLRLVLLGPGTINESERGIIEGIIADPTKLTTLDSSNKVKLNQLSKMLKGNLKSAANARGLDYTGMSPEEAQRLSLAKQRLQANPKDDVARKYIEKFGE